MESERRYPRWEAPTRPSLRADPCADERVLQVSLGWGAAIEVGGYGTSIEAGVSAAQGRTADPGAYAEAEAFFGGVPESLDDLLKLRGGTGKFGPSLIVAYGPRATAFLSRDSFREYQAGPVTISPPTECGDWQVGVSAGFGFGARSGLSYKLNVNEGILSGGLKSSIDYLQEAFDAWHDDFDDNKGDSPASTDPNQLSP